MMRSPPARPAARKQQGFILAAGHQGVHLVCSIVAIDAGFGTVADGRAGRSTDAPATAAVARRQQVFGHDSWTTTQNYSPIKIFNAPMIEA
jgi:hypothetical protein